MCTMNGMTFHAPPCIYTSILSHNGMASIKVGTTCVFVFLCGFATQRGAWPPHS